MASFAQWRRYPVVAQEGHGSLVFALTPVIPLPWLFWQAHRLLLGKYSEIVAGAYSAHINYSYLLKHMLRNRKIFTGAFCAHNINENFQCQLIEHSGIFSAMLHNGHTRKGNGQPASCSPSRKIMATLLALLINNRFCCISNAYCYDTGPEKPNTARLANQ